MLAKRLNIPSPFCFDKRQASTKASHRRSPPSLPREIHAVQVSERDRLFNVVVTAALVTFPISRSLLITGHRIERPVSPSTTSPASLRPDRDCGEGPE